MSTLSKRDRARLIAVIQCLDPSSPEFRGSEEMRQALSDRRVRLYLTTWCIPAIETVAGLPDEDRCDPCTSLVTPRVTT